MQNLAYPETVGGAPAMLFGSRIQSDILCGHGAAVWILAFTVAVLIHLAGFMALTYLDDAGARDIGIGGTEISISMAAALRGDDRAVSGTETVTEFDPVETVDTQADLAPVPPPEAEASDATVSETVQMPTAETAIQQQPPLPVETLVPVQDVQPVEIQEVREETTVPVTEVITPRPPSKPSAPETVASEVAPAVAEPAEPEVTADTPTEPVVTETEPTAPTERVETSDPAARTITTDTPTETVEKPANAEQSAGAVESSGQSNAADTGAATDKVNSLGGGAVQSANPDYISQVRFLLERNKKYPKLARRKRVQGVVVIEIRILRDGTIKRGEIVESSGSDLLDEETMAMLKRASPLPPFPVSMNGGYLDLIVPVEFSIRGNQ